MKPNEIPTIPVYKNERLPTPDEYDTQSICENIVECGGCVIKGAVPGTGKSYIGEYFRKLGYKVLFVVPPNNLGQNCDCYDITVNKFFSIAINEDERLPAFNFSPYDAIVFDEIYFNPLPIYARINRFVKQNLNNKIIIATGDTDQLPTIQPLSNTRPFQEYADKCIKIIF